jgi:hypothetical protein
MDSGKKSFAMLTILGRSSSMLPDLSGWLFLSELHSCIARFRFAGLNHIAVRNNVRRANLGEWLPVPIFGVSAQGRTPTSL